MRWRAYARRGADVCLRRRKECVSPFHVEAPPFVVSLLSSVLWAIALLILGSSADAWAAVPSALAIAFTVSWAGQLRRARSRQDGAASSLGWLEVIVYIGLAIIVIVRIQSGSAPSQIVRGGEMVIAACVLVLFWRTAAQSPISLSAPSSGWRSEAREVLLLVLLPVGVWFIDRSRRS
jgi:hypothetical protein